MSDKSKIEWTDATWSPVTGCTKVSQGCHHCYAERDWKRLSANPKTVYAGRKFTDVQVHPERLGLPLRWRKPRRIFVNSMSDLFHEQIPFEFIAAVFAVMGVTTRHSYQILTKRPERMLEFFRWCAEEGDDQPDDKFLEHHPCIPGTGPYCGLFPWRGYDNCGPAYPYENVWLGVSVEDQATADERIPLLLDTPAAVRFLSCEPLLGTINLRSGVYEMPVVRKKTGTSLYNIHWVIAGGESGPKARPMHPTWVRHIRDQCRAAGVPFYFKQWGEWCPDAAIGVNIPVTSVGEDYQMVYRWGKKQAGRTLDGETWDQYPEVIQR